MSAVQERFRVGERVRVRADYPRGHIRTPFYIRGKHGIVAESMGDFPNPEVAAISGDTSQLVALYRVRFSQHETWPRYEGPAGDTLDVEIYEHWLEPEDAP